MIEHTCETTGSCESIRESQEQCEACRGRVALGAIVDVGLVPLNPGIIKTVAWLRSQGFDTCDSGDGVTHAMEGDAEFSYVAVKSEPYYLVRTAENIATALRNVGIEIVQTGAEEEGGVSIIATFDAADRAAIVIVVGITDKMLAMGGIS